MTIHEIKLVLDAATTALEKYGVEPELQDICKKSQDFLEPYFYENYDKKGLSHQQFLEDQINALEALCTSPAIFGGLV